MRKITKSMVLILSILMLTLNLSSALIINSVTTDTLTPGQEGIIRIEIENPFDDKVEDVSLNLQFTNLPFIPIGSSEQSIEEIEDNEEEVFVYRIKSSSNIAPGDYEIPYTLKYVIDSVEKSRIGAIGVKVQANPDLSFSISTENPVQNKQGSITLKIVNKGFSDARFVSIKALPEGFTLLSEDEIYIGTVDSDDFETATFDVIFQNQNSDFVAVVEYKDFENKKIIENVNLPIKVYSEEKAIELGITPKNNTLIYVAIAIAIVFVIILWRVLKKRRRLKRSLRNNGS